MPHEVYKYVISPGIFDINIPHGGKFLDIQVQRGKVMLWAMVTPGTSEARVRFGCFGTGWELPNDICSWNYIKTVQIDDLVWHVFVREVSNYMMGGLR